MNVSDAGIPPCGMSLGGDGAKRTRAEGSTKEHMRHSTGLGTANPSLDLHRRRLCTAAACRSQMTAIETSRIQGHGDEGLPWDQEDVSMGRHRKGISGASTRW